MIIATWKLNKLKLLMGTIKYGQNVGNNKKK